MTIRRSVAAALAASLLVGAMPRSARADDQAAPGQAPLNLRAAIQREAAQLAPSSSAQAPKQHSAQVAMQQGFGGGGGGKGMLIVTLVSTVVGLAATYYMIKEIQKQTPEGQGK